ncbi:hypothetical protein GCM10010169_63950 [Micromonospora fulviviridis]|uniref:hypothetical protein n=1 Tax=Micromonospora fulviviridis TaxID=47860 RepID=UPI00166B98E5|nr:hypothetical protein [Micromonospora fulviviridis]GGS10472.1 hypothetical protein GCM10010169_63950 [Micromonospora fulviviridis]
MPIFDEFIRADHSPRKPNEAEYTFLNRSARPTFAEVRRLLTEWAGQYPSSERNSLIKSMQAGDDHEFESAFWELYLHEAYRRAGYSITVHPEVPGSSKHPDFLIDNGESSFYLEAVRANIATRTLAEKRRLNDVHAVLEKLSAETFKISFAYDSVGLRPLATTKLRNQLTQWLASLDPHAVSAAFAGNPSRHTLPRLAFKEDGWSLTFTALPLRPDAFGKGGQLVGTFGPGRAAGVDNVTPLTRAVDAKANRYGKLDAPLIIAVMANTEYPTRDYDIQRILYGLSAAIPRQASKRPSELHQDGHWLTRKGWRRGHAPQVVTASNLKPWRVANVQPSLWTTLEPGVNIPLQPRWLAPVSVDTPEPTISPAQRINELFGLPDDWPSG